MPDPNTNQLIDLLFGSDPNAVYYRAAALAAIAVVIAFVWAAIWRKSWNPEADRDRPLLVRFFRRVTVCLLIAVCLHFQVNTIIKERKFKLVEDTLYLPNAKTVRLVAVGYDELLADLLFLRSIQAYGGGWQFSGKGGRPKLFEHYYNVITDLDPHFTRAYTFGNMMIGEEMRAPAPAMGLLAKGIFLNPKAYRVAFEAGFFAVDHLDDYERGTHYLRWAVEAPDVPSWVERQISFFKIKQGDYRSGYERYIRLLLETQRDDNWVEELIATSRIKNTMHDWGKKIIAKALDKYKAKYGVYPRRLGALEEGGFIEPYDFLDARQIVTPGDDGLTMVERAPLLGYDIDEQVEMLLKAMELRSQSIPPTYETRGWIYFPNNQKGEYNLEPSSEGQENLYRFLQLYRQVVEVELRATGMPPLSLDKLLESVSSDKAGRSSPDPRGTFLCYNPATGEINFYSTFFTQPELFEE